MVMSLESMRVKFKPRIKLNHTMCIVRLFIAFVLLLHVVDILFSSPFFQQNLTKGDLVKQYLRSNG